MHYDLGEITPLYAVSAQLNLEKIRRDHWYKAHLVDTFSDSLWHATKINFGRAVIETIVNKERFGGI